MTHQGGSINELLSVILFRKPDNYHHCRAESYYLPNVSKIADDAMHFELVDLRFLNLYLIQGIEQMS